jgi:hypothetical protein
MKLTHLRIRGVGMLLIMIGAAVAPSVAWPTVVIGGQDNSQAQVNRPEFHYVILDTWVRQIGSLNERHVIVLMDEKAFSEDNLKKLAALLSKRYPRPESLTAWIKTNLAQVRTPEELDLSGHSGGAGDYGAGGPPQGQGHTETSKEQGPYESDNYPDAVLFRGEDGSEEINYYTVNPPRDGKIIIQNAPSALPHDRN